MITAIDTNVLLDVFTADPSHGPASRRALATCLDEGPVLACAVVWAEVTAAFGEATSAQDAILAAGVTFTPLAPAAAGRAGEAWRAYRAQGGSRERLLPDFLVGAHAATASDRLLTRDRGFSRDYFPGLEVLDPAAS